MTDKELLLKDLCARLPYGVKVEITHWRNRDKGIMDSKILRFPLNINKASVLIKPTSDVRPYLYPLSSMTDEQYEELFALLDKQVEVNRFDFIDLLGYSEIGWYHVLKAIDWLNKNHFDYRELIEKGLALDATGLNVY